MKLVGSDVVRRRTPTVLQHEAAECGVACLAIVLGYHGCWVPLEELRAVAGVNRDGIKATAILRTAARYGLDGKGYSVEADAIAAADLPAIVFWQFNHFVVVEGRSRDKVWINDPASGPREITAREFNDGFTGVMLSLRPDASFRRAGHAPSLHAGIRESLAGFAWPVAGAVGAGLLLIVPGLVVPGLQRSFIDYFLIGGLDNWLGWLIGGIAALAVARALLVFLQQRVLARFQVRFGVATSGRLMWRILHLPVSYFAQRSSGDLAGRLSVADRLTGLLSGTLAVTVISLITIVGYAVIMAAYDLPLTLLVCLFAGLNLGLLMFLSRRLSDAHRRLLQDDARLQAMLLQGFANIETYRASGTESLFFRRWAGGHAKVVSAEQAMAVWQRLLGSLPVMLTTIAGVAIVLVGGMRVMDGTLSVGMLVGLQALMFNFNGPVAGLVGLGGQLQQTRGYVERLGDVMHHDTDPMLTPHETPHREKAPGGALALEGVSFGYSAVGPALLSDLSFALGAGERIAIVGPSGSGKSTLSKLVAGLLLPRSGNIRLDGSDIALLPNALVRATMAYVEQATTLFAGSVRDNLTLWDQTIEEERMVAAARDAMVHEVIAGRPTSYETRVEENGRNFSGGERQRLAIARALAVDPQLLVLDEATSALDAIVEQAIMDNIRRRGCTCVLISHRLSAVRDCDSILVLDAGRVAERGRHEELLAQGGIYSRLVQA